MPRYVSMNIRNIQILSLLTLQVTRATVKNDQTSAKLYLDLIERMNGLMVIQAQKNRPPFADSSAVQLDTTTTQISAIAQHHRDNDIDPSMEDELRSLFEQPPTQRSNVPAPRPAPAPLPRK
jgi:hypothetical protein